MASIKGRARQRVKARLRKAFDDDTVNQCYDKDGSVKAMEARQLDLFKVSVYYIWQALTDTDEESAQKYLDLISATICTGLRQQ